MQDPGRNDADQPQAGSGAPVQPPASEPVGHPPPPVAPEYASAPEYAAPQYEAPQYEAPQYEAPAATPSPTERRGPGFGAMLASAVLGGLVGAAVVAGAALMWLGFSPKTATGPVKTPAQTVKTIVSSGASASIEAVASDVLPSVVNVSVAQQGSDMFGGSQTVEGEGSGVIIRADGYILTNNHVVEGADEITVRIGTEELPAKVVGTDPSSDLAVIRVSRKGLPAARLGVSEDLQVGQTVVAFGSPFGLDKTVTSGIISALHRTNLEEGAQRLTAYTNLIQTDAAINPGNSGGPLTDLLGRVVGINTLIQTGGAQQSAGIGFAIPIDFARNVAEQLIRTGTVQHPFMGVSTSNVDGQTSVQGTAPVSSGALVEEVVSGSPADKAGIEQGDIIVKIEDTDVTGYQDVFAAVRSHNVGETVTVTIVGEDGSRRDVQVTLGSDAQAR